MCVCVCVSWHWDGQEGDDEWTLSSRGPKPTGRPLSSGPDWFRVVSLSSDDLLEDAGHFLLRLSPITISHWSRTGSSFFFLILNRVIKGSKSVGFTSRTSADPLCCVCVTAVWTVTVAALYWTAWRQDWFLYLFFFPLLLLCHVHKKKNPSQLNHICWDLLNLCALLLWLHSDNWTCWNGSSNLQSGVLMNCVLCLLLSGSYSHRCDKGGLWFSTCGPSVQSLWNIGIVLAAVATVLFNYGHVQNIIPRTGLIQDALARELVINYLYSTIK